MSSNSEFSRQVSLARLADEQFDLVVVGGGITGAGCALDAASRGLSVALIEKDDFASGTSSKSSKLIHGGLRYLQQRRVVLVYEALAERQRLLRNAPHLVNILPFLIPVFNTDGIINPKVARALGTALWAYDLTGGFRIGKKHKRVSKEASLELFPTLPADRLEHGYIYYDCEADDARLTLAILRTAAVEFQAVAANHVAARGINKNKFGLCQGVAVETQEGDRFDIKSSAVINAAGVWADEVRQLDTQQAQKHLRPAKGIHVALPRRLFGNETAAVVPVGKDGRSIFVIPWESTTYLGTTDTDYSADIDSPECTLEDVEYLLGAARDNTTAQISVDDVLGVWAGLRPLVKDVKSLSTADLSRRHSVSVSKSGVVTVVGGKLTTYRKMAADAVDEAMEFLGDIYGDENNDFKVSSSTLKLSLVGAPEELEASPVAPATPFAPVVEPVKKFLSSRWNAWADGKEPAGGTSTGAVDAGAAGTGPDGMRPDGMPAPPNGMGPTDMPAPPTEFLSESALEHLFNRYGTETPKLLELAQQNPGLAASLHPELPYLKAEVVHSVRNEMATTLDDILSRRLRARLLNATASSEVAPQVASLVASELGWNEQRTATEIDCYRQSVEHELFSWRK